MSSTTTVSTSANVSVEVGSGSTAEKPATIASGNGGWLSLFWSASFYHPTTETITLTGSVTGNGYLRLQGHSANSTTFRFTGSDTSSWFAGTLSLANAYGGDAYLQLADARWQAAVVDFDLYETTGGVPISNSNSNPYSTATPTKVGLILTGDGSVAALSGGATGGVVTGNGYTLTLAGGGLTASDTYAYNGTLSSDLSLSKSGEYTQVITGDRDLKGVTVSGGTLNFSGNLNDTDNNGAINVTGGKLLVGALNNDGTLDRNSNSKLYGTDITVSGGELGVSGGMTAGGTLTVSGGVVNSVEGAINAGSLVVEGGTIYAGVDAQGNNTNVTVSAGINITKDATISGNGVLKSDEHMAVSGTMTVEGGAVELGSLYAAHYTQSAGRVTMTGNATLDTAALSGGSLTVGGTLNSDHLTLSGGTLTTGGVDVEMAYLSDGMKWYTYGTTSIKNMVLSSDSNADTRMVYEGVGENVVWKGLTNADLTNYNTDNTETPSLTMSNGWLRMDNVVTIIAKDVTITEKDGIKTGPTLNFAKLTNVSTSFSGVTEGTPGVYIVSGSTAYEGEFQVTGNVLQIVVTKEADNSIVVNSGSNLRISHEVDGLYDIYRDATYNATDKTWNSSSLEQNSEVLPNRIYLNQGAAFYLNDEFRNSSSVGGENNVIEILPTTNAELKPAHIHVENSIPVWKMGGILTGMGEVHLVAHMSPTSQDSTSPGVTIFRYTNENQDTLDAWFSGTLGLANAHGGDVQLDIGNPDLDIGNTDNSTRWQNTLFDLGPREAECIMHDTTQTGVAANTILLLEGHTAIKGLITSGTPDAAHQSRVVTNTGSYTLTLGTDMSATPYVYSGVLGSGEFYSTKSGSPTKATSMAGSLNLHKVGSNTQVFTQDTTLGTVNIEKGTLAFTGALNSSEVTVQNGGTLVTANVDEVPIVNLHAGGGWYVLGDMMSSATRLNFSGDGTVSLGSYTGGEDAVFYIPVKLDMSRSEGIGYSPDKALFTKQVGNTLNLNTDNALNFIYTDKSEDVIYVVTNVMNPRESAMLEDVEGRFVDVNAAGTGADRYYAAMNFDESTGTLTATRTGIQVYSWMGEKNGTKPDGLCLGADSNLVYGNIWTADGSSTNTGWHEQNMGAGQGVFVNGSYVDFVHTGIHGESVEVLDVDIRGAVAPGRIYVNTEAILPGSSARKYGYAFASSDGTGKLVDYDSANPTRLVKEGEGMLILDVANETSGGVSLRHGALYAAVPTALGKGTLDMHDGTDLYVNYAYSTDPTGGYRNPVVVNDINLVCPDAEVSIGYAPFVYQLGTDGAVDISGVARHWRYMLLNGQLTGEKDSVVTLRGYNSCWDKTSSGYLELYTSGFTLKNGVGNEGGTFLGTIKLANQVNTSTLTGNDQVNDSINFRLTGDVRLNLSDDYLENAKLDLTRETAWTTPEGGTTAEFRQTYHHLVMIEGDTTIRGLEAELLGCTPLSANADNSEVISNNSYLVVNGHKYGDYYQADEVALVNVATAGSYTLNLNNDGAEYWYSGRVGVKTQYEASEAVEPTYYNPLNPESGDKTTETLSLVMDSANGDTGAQYIHTAQLVNLTLKNGTLGFNQLDVSGDVFMNSGTTLKNSVQHSSSNDVSGKVVDTSWSGTDEDGLIIHSGKALTVNLLNQEKAVIDSDVTLQNGSGLYFLGNDQVAASTAKDGVFLDVNGKLTLTDNESLAITLHGIQYNENTNKTTYYIAEADSIAVSGEPATFTQRIITLGGGYVGILGVEDNTDSEDYLTIKVTGDPRRTWTGDTSSGNTYTWTPAKYNNTATDGGVSKTNKWKEDLTYFDGCIVLFGNLYEANNPSDTTIVDIADEKTGWPTDTDEGTPVPNHFVDDEAVSYQYVNITDAVAPLTVTVNGAYTDASGKEYTDDTNYVFGGSGKIVDVSDDDLSAFYTKNELNNLGLLGWKTNLIKDGTGTLVITNANTYSGGTALHGGTIVMQNASALGTGTVTISGGSTLQADFGETATTSTITNEVRAFNRDTAGVGFGVTKGGDAYVAALMNDSDKRLVVVKLTGQADAAVLLKGHAATADQREDGNYSIGVFQLNDVSAYYGTLRMQGEDGAGVQLNVASGGTYNHLTLDLSLNGSSSTAVFLVNEASTLPVLEGSADGGTGVSHVVTKEDVTHKLTLHTDRDGVYFGNVGYGFYQKADGTKVHNTGTINLTVTGSGEQTIGNAELGSLDVQEGYFNVSRILQVDSISNKDATSKIRVGTVDGTADAAPHTIVVDMGGILALGGSGDVLQNVKNGVAAEESNKQEAYLLLTDGATLTAHDDWATSKKIDIHRNPTDADGSEVTINTHHFEVDPWDYNRLGTEAASTDAHIIQLNGDITGDNATVNITNDALNTNGAQTDVVSAQQGYVAIKDINQVTNSTFNITDMATLQLTAGQSDSDSDTSASSVQVNIDGTQATLHVLEGKQTAAQSVSIAHSGGQVLVGGNAGDTVSDSTNVELIIRAHKEAAELTNVMMKSADNMSTLDSTNGAQQAILDNAIVAAMGSCTVKLNNVLVTDTSVINGGNELLASSTPTSIATNDAPIAAGATAVTMGYENTTVQISSSQANSYDYGTRSGSVYHALVDQFNNVDVGGDGVTLQIADNLLNAGSKHTVIALQISGGAGQFRYEGDEKLDYVKLSMSEGYIAKLITSDEAASALGLNSGSVTDTMLYITVESVPEPTTTTLSLLALTALMARRRRK